MKSILIWWKSRPIKVLSFSGPEGKRPRKDTITGRDVRPDALLAWLGKQVEPYSEVGVSPVVDMTTSFQV